ncbi:hypothetical protein [Nostoc sp. TCL26-01]|nr:hypothetical protein [Nostoc sp. TCL26-01]
MSLNFAKVGGLAATVGDAVANFLPAELKLWLSHLPCSGFAE